MNHRNLGVLLKLEHQTGYSKKPGRKYFAQFAETVSRIQWLSMSIVNRFSKYQAKFHWHAGNKGIRHAYIKASSLPQLKGKAMATRRQNFFIAGEQQIRRLTSPRQLEERSSAQIENTTLTLAASSSNGCHPKTINTKVFIENPEIIINPMLPATIATMSLKGSARSFIIIF